ncbi:MAG TPA: dicarboxylate/amino acid:cation symporter [Flavobacterium sp.]|uniref:dicarboxylate/amino acid:cation symporter n=1 Tax=unclassified Flavobacterium TaxID=196869 RepID=UPI000E9619B2|nr:MULTISPECIES: dicarboxylate/amino acid:cation symporter [unclassified Flavobacterium]HBI00436.1 dicarboxylate/amino acid:cation symporter [Flavobacterium sp.]HRE78764.1 dicarboxylate/amino acid:cation symporter [Flavobacterium sp.]
MKLALHWKILIGMILGLVFGYLMKNLELREIVVDWVKPFGTIFINLLKMIAVPLIVVSLIVGLSDLKDIAKLSKLGGRTVALYLFSTVCAVSIGLVLANLIRPGDYINDESRKSLLESFAGDAAQKIELAEKAKNSGPLQPLVDVVPENFFMAMTDNASMLQVILFVILLGIGLILIDENKAKPVVDFFKGLNDVILKIIDIIMLGAPIGVFALMAALMVEIPDFSTLNALLIYALTVVIGLSVMVFVLYPTLLIVLAKYSPVKFFKAISPAQLLAFSTSSSAATLPVTMERVTEHVGVDEEVSSFVLPLGATVNMDGTSLYQAVAAVFIAQAMGIPLDLQTQLMIVVTATLASIGSAAVPSAGMVMLVIVLGQAGIPEAGLALIFAIDRPLDMCRTVVNVTSDATVATVVAKSVGKLHDVDD